MLQTLRQRRRNVDFYLVFFFQKNGQKMFHTLSFIMYNLITVRKEIFVDDI